MSRPQVGLWQACIVERTMYTFEQYRSAWLLIYNVLYVCLISIYRCAYLIELVNNGIQNSRSV